MYSFLRASAVLVVVSTIGLCAGCGTTTSKEAEHHRHPHVHHHPHQHENLGYHDHGVGAAHSHQETTPLQELEENSEFDSLSLGGNAYLVALSRKDSGDKIDGRGKIVVRSDLGLMSDELRTQVENKAHGQAAVLADGSIVECIEGAGLILLPPDLGTWKVIQTQDPELKTVNGHGICSFTRKGVEYIGIASNNRGRIYIVNREGAIVHRLATPKGDEFSRDYVNAAYQKRKGGHTSFTGICFLESEDSLVVTTGYDGGRGDFTLQIRWKDDAVVWGPAGVGEHRAGKHPVITSHSVSSVPGTNKILVASRENWRYYTLELKKDEFSYIDTVDVQKAENQKTRVCHVARLNGLDWIAVLDPTRGHKTASALVYDESKKQPVGQVVVGRRTNGYYGRCLHVHGVTPFLRKNKDGSSSLMAVLSFWPDNRRHGKKGPRTNIGAIVLVEVVPDKSSA